MCPVFVVLLLAMVGGTMSLLHVHHGNVAMASYLREVNNKYPDITKLYSIGESVKGRVCIIAML
ncbi:hypothetical protein DPMN_128631 [Dreissena polymorpha]|uniref:Peptidase M14 domain-containing protein n=1 Tax=Dreissena polymorpha TaxID=45954 RepID=A0A9D4H4C6_DREPO|nr:hypothetical protein DPMN_128565 [Dreissena polymorpha]KAH3826721.1 hypothetical protein DPMN_128631 [Dreissena polymorpha]